jgi:uncharacterized beta-barrel protein YwiB (DUF1934 family)
MLKKVKLKIESTIDNLSPAGLPEGEPEKNISECEGVLRVADGRTSLTYTEKSEGGDIRSQIICLDGQVTVTRSGAIESELCFVEGQTHHSIYSIPPYRFDASVKAKRVRVDIGEEEGKIDLLYNMTVGGAEKTARMKIWILQASSQA